MNYKYINKQAPKEKINYSYSIFGGEDFLLAWEESRNQLNLLNHFSSDILNPESNSSTEKLFISWIEKFELDRFNNFDELNLLLKRFEVTKRIYSRYDKNFRRIDKNDFEELKLYILFAYILTLAYAKSKKLPYLNSLLKVNDINISNVSNFSSDIIELLGYCVQKEKGYIIGLRQKLK